MLSNTNIHHAKNANIHHYLIPGSAEYSQHMPVPIKQMQKEGAKQNLEELVAFTDLDEPKVITPQDAK